MSARRLPGPRIDIDARVEVPTSKSLTNRALIAAAAAGGGRIVAPLDCEDTRLLAGALAAAGWPLRWSDDIEIGARRPAPRASVDLGNSGTGSRLVLGLLACVPGHFRVDGSVRLRQRPMQPILDALQSLGAVVRSRDGFLPAEIEGRPLAGGSVLIRPGVSSQFVSSLLLAAPLMEHGLQVEVLGPVPSRPYLDLTREVLEAFGATVTTASEGRWRVDGGGLRPTTYGVEGDWSAVAFAAAAVAVAGGSAVVEPLSPASAQGDRAVCGILERAGVGVELGSSQVRFSGRATRPFTADLTDNPDLFPALSVVAATAPPGSVLSGLQHLRHKESDRLSVMVDNLGRLGAGFEIVEAELRVASGIVRTRGPVAVTAAEDHRIAMAMAVAALAAGPLDLDDDRCVGKSFPSFWRMWETLLEGAATPP